RGRGDQGPVLRPAAGREGRAGGDGAAVRVPAARRQAAGVFRAGGVEAAGLRTVGTTALPRLALTGLSRFTGRRQGRSPARPDPRGLPTRAAPPRRPGSTASSDAPPRRGVRAPTRRRVRKPG